MSVNPYVYKGQEVKVKPSRYHRIEDHNYWIKRIGKCPYCHSGSKPVHSSLINNDGEWKELKHIKIYKGIIKNET